MHALRTLLDLEFKQLQVIERTFGVFKRRWGIFKRPLEVSARRLPLLVGVAMKLHNYILDEDNLSAKYKVGSLLMLFARSLCYLL